ncbi:unnamed protein product [Mytilus coruscus]|uniref:Uncharacterized protein n=1 Tax=Mytilus coruscus TaxID=42192 RepID=A0A6J8DLQ7_MYTCO|nr:unnamed protein product [Mytilus coruscus]
MLLLALQNNIDILMLQVSNKKHVKSIPNANNSNSFSKVRKIKQSFTPNLDITSASECDETDDEVFSDACSDIDTNSIDTDVITQSKRSKSKIGFSNAKLPSFTGKENGKSGLIERVNTADQELALFNENGHKLDNIGVHEPTSSITLFRNSHSKEENITNSGNISNSGNNSNSNSKEENISNSGNNSNSKEENISNSGNISNSNSKEENISNSGNNSNSKEENISNRENIVKHGDNSNTSSVTLEDKNLVCSTPILGSEQSIASNVIARQVIPK